MYYVTSGDAYQQQPQSYVKQMGPAPQPIDPRAVAAFMQQAQAYQQAPMSASDGVSITITVQPEGVESAQNYVDPYLQQGRNFSQSNLGQMISQGYEDGISEEHRPIKKRAADILSQHLGYENPDEMSGSSCGGSMPRRRLR